MKVVCIKILNPVTQRQEDSSHWLALDTEYIVLSMQASPRRGLALRVIDNEGEASGIWPAEIFMTTSSKLPSNWVASIGEDGLVDLAPGSWLRAGFWEDYFDRDPEAVALFEEEKNKILLEADSEP